MNGIHTRYHKTPNNIFKLNLTPNELVVLSYLLSLSNNKEIYPSKNTIASNTNMSKRSVDKSIATLLEKGFIEYKKGSSKNRQKICNQYKIKIEKIDPVYATLIEPIKKDEEDSFIEHDFVKEYFKGYES